MTPKAYVIHYAMRKSLLPRVSYREGFTNLQQHLLRALLTRTQFCVVDFLIAEMEDVITDGMGSQRSFPYAHFISYMLRQIDHVPRAEPTPQFQLYSAAGRPFKTHKARAPPAPRVAVQAPVPPEGPPSSPSTTTPAGGDTAIAEESDDNTDSEDEPELTLPTFPHDHEAEGSRDPPPPPQVTAAQVAMAADIATVLHGNDGPAAV